MASEKRPFSDSDFLVIHGLNIEKDRIVIQGTTSGLATKDKRMINHNDEVE